MSVADFRIDRRKKFPLFGILMIAVCAMIDGAKGPTDFERFGSTKLVIGQVKAGLRSVCIVDSVRCSGTSC